MGVQLGLMGVQLGGKVIWAGLRGCGCGAGTAGQQREAVHRASLMIKCSEAAAAVRPGPAAPFRLTALVVSAVHMPGPVERAGAAASFRLRIAGPAGPFVLAWSGDRSPIRGCTTTRGDQVPLGHEYWCAPLADRAERAVPVQNDPLCALAAVRNPSSKGAHIGGSARGYLAVGRSCQQSRYGLLDGRLFCIFIHHHPWGECPHLPPTGRGISSLRGSRQAAAGYRTRCRPGQPGCASAIRARSRGGR